MTKLNEVKETKAKLAKLFKEFRDLETEGFVNPYQKDMYFKVLRKMSILSDELTLNIIALENEEEVE